MADQVKKGDKGKKDKAAAKATQLDDLRELTEWFEGVRTQLGGVLQRLHDEATKSRQAALKATRASGREKFRLARRNYYERKLANEQELRAKELDNDEKYYDEGRANDAWEYEQEDAINANFERAREDAQRDAQERLADAREQAILARNEILGTTTKE
jgi:hypothetical protein